ncbi:pyridoxal phosphate-dependent aminotransferase [Aureispira anguillae]|uniref:Aminotransferase n=1 Tax=Aureispira anguillae TaxID=2864201 RepID=A0A916DSH9_9BACT|nr:aminotransferase class I/II-fold pyridoxal phosphate-dependent enzyme [Aureispira anguillae]BDS11185.1 aminotransferase class I/II-fold pyridoxal phosphate-dependent enzyme [Aureispira anguillae]
MLKGHGDDRYLFDCEIVADFSSNVIANHSVQITESLKEACWQSIERYPDPNGECLSRALAKFHHLAKEQVLVCNGATEAFYLLAKYFEQSSATIFVPTFSEYQDACQINHIKTQLLPWDALEKGIQIQSKIIFICNPNNPTGHSIPLDQLVALLKNHPASYLIIDEAYIEFSDQCESAVGLLSTYSNLVVVKSLTKSFAIPGLRLGYILGQASLIAALAKNKMPWSTNSIALTIGLHLINHYDQFIFDQKKLRQQTEQFRQKVDAIEGLTAHPTSTNYFLLELTKGKAADLKLFLVEQYGILIRDASNFEGLNAFYCRLACQTVEKNNLLINALKKWMD